ncbi:MAG: alpha/beta fold hydrolase [Alphaproteobacteria bacterium]|nr:alpha/beta fold hydrolase [Alphaproteobacteria bacterium]
MPMTPEHDGVAINYETHGDGPPLILISGTGHDLHFWSGQVPFFSKKFRTIVFDNRGVGASSVPEPGYSLADMADDTARVLDDAGIGQAHVMGFSMGGHIAQELTLNHADRVLSLGIHHSWTRNGARLRKFQETRRYLAENDQRVALAELSMLALHASAYYDAHVDEMEGHRRFLLDGSPVNAGWIGQLEGCLAGDTYDRLPQIAVPTLITCSDLDLIASPHLSEEIHSRIPGSELKILKGTGHVALMEAPEMFADVCLEFLDRVTA